MLKNINDTRFIYCMQEKIKVVFAHGTVLADKEEKMMELVNNSCLGTITESKVQLSLLEAFYLYEKEKLEIMIGKKEITRDQIIKKFSKIEPNFMIRYRVFKDIRERGYIIKTALKFGADFRVYDRGIKPGQDHAKWVVFPVSEGWMLTWHDFAAKNRVAHSTKKRLLIGVVDDEGEVSYWEIKWVRP